MILVSSGVIAVGMNKLEKRENPSSMRMKQAAAAVGQCIMYLYDKFFGDYDKTIAQILRHENKTAGGGIGRRPGIDTVITNGRRPEALYEIVCGKSAGTWIAGNH